MGKYAESENKVFWNKELEKMKGFRFDADHYDIVEVSKYDKECYVIEDELFNDMIYFCEKNHCTIYPVILTAMMCALYEIEFKEEVTVWSAVSNSFYNNSLGNMSVLSLPFCVRFNENDKKINDILHAIIYQTAQIIDHQDISLNELLGTNKNLMVQSIDEISNIFFNFTEEKYIEEGDVEEIVLDEIGNTKYEVNFDCILHENKIVVQVSYATNLFRKSRISTLVCKTIEFLHIIIQNRGIKLVENKMKKRNYFHSQNNILNVQSELSAKFVENVMNKPHADAIIMGNQCLNYKELYDHVLRSIAYLMNNGFRRGDCIAIVSDKNIESVVCIAALLFGGYTYVPISKDYPLERIKSIVEICNVKGIIFDELYGEDILRKEVKNMIVSEVFEACSVNEFKMKLPYRMSDEIAYIMHTSGSSGNPKGVKVSWGNLSNYCSQNGISKIITSMSSFRILSVTNLEFDISITEIFLPFIYGGCCIIAPKVLEDELLLQKYTTQYSADVIQTTPTNMKRLMMFFKGDWIKKLNLIFIGGENFPKHLYEDICQKTNATICNIYGPTEATVWATYKIINEKPLYNNIGNCLDNYKIYIMQNDKEADIECVGEICIGGDSVAIGYVGGDDLEKFKELNGERLYFTGDMGRRMNSGEIEFLGRKDTQIKKGGYRIELEEIAENVKKIDGIKEVVACVKKYANEEQICLYYTAENEQREGIETFLLERLPRYMIPTHYIKVKEFPLTPNGKINLKNLPDPCYEIRNITSEKKLCSEYRDILTMIRKVFSNDSIGIVDNFWNSGGNSIKAVALINAVEKKYGIRIKLAKILQKTTIGDIIEYIITSMEDNIYKRYHATPAQKRIYAIQTLNRNSIAYNMPVQFRMCKYFEPEEIKKCIENIIKEFEILRTRFQTDEGDLWQVVFPYNDSEIKIVRDNNISPQEEMKRFVKPFSLENESLFRVEIFITNNEEYILFDVHHIVSDENSNNNIFNMLERALLGKETLSEESISYGEYSEIVCKQNYAKEESEWKRYFNQVKLERLTLPRENTLDFINIEGAKEILLLSPNTFEKVRNISVKLHCSVYSILLTFLLILLKKICYQDRITVACPTSTRNREDIENSLGLFVNTSIISEEIADYKTIESLIIEVQERILFVMENVNYPFEKIVSLCDVESVEGQNPVFDVLFSYYEESEYELFEQVDNFDGIPKVDLTFNILQKGSEMFFECEYFKNHYSGTRIKTILQKYKQLLDLYIDNLDVAVKACDICLPYEKEIVLNKFNCPIELSKYGDKCLQDYLAIQAQLNPDKIALEMDGKSMSFRQLHIESDMLASKLLSKGIKEGAVIPLIIHRSMEMFIGIWGILKAGCAYLPIKPEEPDTRVKYMINNVGANCIICEKDMCIRLNNIFTNILLVTVKHNENESYSEYVTEYKTKADNLAYVIYTSGTTGNPKGVMVEHRSVINRIEWMIKKYNVCSEDRILFKTPFSFDVSVWEIFMGAFCGATVCILSDGDEKEPEMLEKAIWTYRISIMHFVPSMLNVFLDYVELNCYSPKRLASLRYIFSSGETLKKDSSELFYSIFKSTKLVNLYGPTEATVDVTYYECTGEEDIVPIGKPIDNINIFILNGDTNTGIGIKGELCITGLGVARGYINDEVLSKEKFVDNLFGPGKMYRTGDIACWNSSGEILFFGRRDRQVKIRGNRIELGEIEEKMLKLPGIKDVKVFVENSCLMAQVVARKELIDKDNIREELALVLPAYMIPNNIFIVPALQLSPSGKALGRSVDMALNNYATKKDIPLDEIDIAIINTMSKILGRSVKMSDNFMRIGGDSIQAIFAANQLQKVGIKVLAKDIVASKELYDLKKVIRKVHSIPAGSLEKNHLLSPIMSDFFNEWQINNKDYFNQSCLLLIRNYDEEKLICSIKRIIMNHEMFWCKFIDNKTFSIKNRDAAVLNNIVDKVIIQNNQFSDEIHQITERIQKSICLERNILFKILVIETEDTHYLYMCVHHLIIDAVSWGIIQAELESLYQNQEALLPESTSFGRWVELINDYRKNISVLEENYWLGVVKELHKLSREDGTNDTIQELEYSFSKWKILVERISNSGIDKKSVILALLIKEIALREPLIVDIENHGRSAIENVDVSTTVGWFTLIYPMLIEPQNNIQALAEHIYEKFELISHDGVAYGLLKRKFYEQGYEHLQAKYCFNYLGKLKDSISDNFVEITLEQLAADTDKHNSMGYDIVFDVFEVDDILKIKFVYKNSKETLVRSICEAMELVQIKLNKNSN